jgi:hypothetical protein
MDTGRCTVRVEPTTSWPLFEGLDQRNVHVVAVQRVCGAWESREPAVAEAAGVLRELLRLAFGEDLVLVLVGAIPAQGAIELTLDGLPAALEVTRTRPAACVAFLPTVPAAERDAVVARLADASGDSRERLRAAVAELREGMLVLRGYGWFDDRDAGAEAFGRADLVRTAASPAAGC